jgi:hypothetical protein
MSSHDSEKESLPEKDGVAGVRIAEVTDTIHGHKIDADIVYDFAIQQRSITEEESVSVRKKLDRYLMPCFIALFVRLHICI